MSRPFTQLRIIFFFLNSLFFSNILFAQDDAGIAAITQPAGTVCRGSSSVEATLHNYASVDLNTATIQWTVNGIPQASYSFSGTLTPGSDTSLSLGVYNFTSGTYAVVAYSENPNGNADADNSNDTATATVSTQLNGVYTLGGTLPDYADFTSAVSDLVNLGICGPVTFNVRAGSYTEKLVIDPIPGASAVNTITFQSENGDSSTAVLTFPSSDTATANYVVRLNGADYITFKQLTISRPGTRTYGRILDYANVASFNVITNCYLLGPVNNTVSNSFGALVYSGTGASSNDSSNSFTNNLFENGSIGIYFNGVGSLSLESSTLIADNEFVNQWARAIQLSNQLSPVITGNFITSNSTLSSYFAIYLNVCQRNLVVSKNYISGVSGIGITLVDCTAFPVPHGLVSNNFVSTTDSMGVAMINGNNQDLVYNSIHVSSSDPAMSALDLHGTNSGIVIKDNALVNSGGGYAYAISDSAFAGIVSSDYNDLYTTGSNVGSYRGNNEANLAAWQSASGLDTNSVSMDPVFVSATDLHATSVSFDDLGTPLTNVLVDIDNEVRSATTPDIGADEYTGQTHDVGIAAILSPAVDDCENSTATVQVIVHNYGAFAESNIPVQADVSGFVNATLNDTVFASIAPGADDTLTFTSTINTLGGGSMVVSSFTQAGTDDDRNNDTMSVNVTVHTTPPPPNAFGGNRCGPGTVVLNANSPSGDTIYWYDASTGGNLVGTGSPFITPFISTTTTFYAEAKGYCPSIIRASAIATIIPLPNVNLGNDTTILLGSPIALDAGAGFVQYFWSTGESTQTISLTPSSDSCVSATVVDVNGCINSDTICINVVFPSDVGVTQLITPSDHQCENVVTPITVVVANFGSSSAANVPVRVDITGAVTVSFMDTVPGPIPAGGNVPFTFDSAFNSTGGGVYTLTTYTQEVTDQSNANDTLVMTLNINPVPLPPVANDDSRCGPGPISIPASGTDTVFWFDAPTGGNLLGIDTLYVLMLTQTTTFYAQTGNACPSAARTAVTITVLPLPVVNLGPDLLIECNVDTTLDAGPGFVLYLWSTGETTQTIVVDTVGLYTVTVTDANGCSNSDTVSVDCFVGLHTMAFDQDVKLYPNPSSGLVHVELAPSIRAVVRIIDARGKIISDEIGEGRLTYDLSGFAKGIYTIQVLHRQSSVYRVVIE